MAADSASRQDVLLQISKQTSIFNTHKKHKDWRSLYKEEEERERRRRLEQEMGQETSTPGSIVAEGGVTGSGAAESGIL